MELRTDDRLAQILVEICVETLDRAIAAERGGADRLELCGDLSSGGVTPDATLLYEVRRKVRIPIHVLIRPNSSNDFCSDADFKAMERDVRIAQETGMNGIVLGIVDRNTLQVDRKRTSALTTLARPLPVTFHRAFDQCPDPRAALEAVIETGAHRVLTSGGKSRVTEAVAAVADLVTSAQNRIVIMPGGGVRAGNVQRVLERTGAKEIHTSLLSPTDRKDAELQAGRKTSTLAVAQFEARVRKFVEVIRENHPTPACTF